MRPEYYQSIIMVSYYLAWWISSCRWVGSVVCVSVLLGSGYVEIVSSADTPVEQPVKGAPPAASEFQDLAFLTPEGPLFLRIQVLIDGQPLSVAFRRFAEALFKAYDRDRDGKLLPSQVRRIPFVAGLFDASAANESSPSQENMRATESEPIAQSAFVDAMQNGLGRLFFMRAASGPADEFVDLFSLLDRDGSRSLTAVELDDAAKGLSRFDFDRSEVISFSELAPFRNPLLPRVTARPETSLTDMPFLLLGPDGDQKESAKLFAAYNSTPGGDSALSAEELGRTSKWFHPWDQDGNQQLDELELLAMTRNPPTDIFLKVELPRERRGVPKMGATVMAEELDAVVTPSDRGRCEISRKGAVLEIRALNSRSQAGDQLRFFQLKFLTADKDKDQRIDVSEYPGLEYSGATFEQIDLDADGKLTREEWVDHLHLDAWAVQTRVIMAVKPSGTDLFMQLDADADKRLSPRELKSAWASIAKLDPNKDGELAKHELSHRFRITISMGEPSIFQVAMTSPAMIQPSAQVVRHSEGPNWFRHMDRNQDRDLSWSEFLGTRDVFRKLDKDGDGLISASEAENSQ
jgi:Ca2+-binding EF-hand superfamily protein